MVDLFYLQERKNLALAWDLEEESFRKNSLCDAAQKALGWQLKWQESHLATAHEFHANVAKLNCFPKAFRNWYSVQYSCISARCIKNFFFSFRSLWSNSHPRRRLREWYPNLPRRYEIVSNIITWIKSFREIDRFIYPAKIVKIKQDDL